MNSSRATMGTIRTATGLAFVVGASRSAFMVLAMNSGTDVLNRLFVQPIALIASVAAASLAFQVAADLPAGSSMRRAWWLMTASAAAAVGRYVMELLAVWWNWKVVSDPIVSLRQVPGVLALVLLLGSLVLMWVTFARMGLGLSLRKRDLLAVFALLILLPPIMSFRESMADAGSIYVVLRYLQFSQPFLLVITGAFAVVLLRIAEETGDGQLARSLRYLAYFLILRLLLMTAAIVPEIQQIVPLKVIRGGFNVAAPCLFTLAISCRWQLTASARAALGRLSPAPAQADRTRAGAIRVW